jgi:hypothetical protein
VNDQSEPVSPIVPKVKVMITFKVMNLNALVSEAEDLVDDRLILVDKIPMVGEPQIEDVSHQKQVTGISAA